MSGGIAFTNEIAWMVGSQPITALLNDLKHQYAAKPQSLLSARIDRALETMLLFVDVSDLTDSEFNDFCSSVVKFSTKEFSNNPSWIVQVVELLKILLQDRRLQNNLRSEISYIIAKYR